VDDQQIEGERLESGESSETPWYYEENVNESDEEV
jgi:hypothetical protein